MLSLDNDKYDDYQASSSDTVYNETHAMLKPLKICKDLWPAFS